MDIPFNKPYMTGKELWYISQAHAFGHLSGDGPFTDKCHKWLEDRIGSYKALLTHSCTAALEMAALLADISPGDEIIMPSYTFVSTANAFVLRGGVPVFVDIDPDTLNLDHTKIEDAITARTKAIVPVHYAGVSCEMDHIMKIAREYNLLVIEDAAQGILCKYKSMPLGSIGHMAAISFHETKNIMSGEGGALLINDERFVERAEILREKGTNRKKFFRGEVDKYTWVDLGSSYLPSDLIAAFLWAQMEEAESITEKRLALWSIYQKSFETMEKSGLIRRPVVPADRTHNAHMFYLLMRNLEERDRFIACLKDAGIHAIFHYIPLHGSIAGRKYCRVHGDLTVTEDVSRRLARLPLWVGLENRINDIIHEIFRHFRNAGI